MLDTNERKSERKSEYKDFQIQYEQRFEEFIDWAIAHWPDKSLGPSPSSFSRCRKELESVISPLSRSGAAAEPAQGGAQYVSVTPAPWP